jgi:hypothetical protein
MLVYWLLVNWWVTGYRLLVTGYQLLVLLISPSANFYFRPPLKASALTSGVLRYVAFAVGSTMTQTQAG